MAHPALARRPRILYLDAYDSFSNNIIAQVEHCIDADIIKCYIDSDPSSLSKGGFLGDTDTVRHSKHQQESDKDRTTNFWNYLKDFDAVIAGPGPGWAKCDQDVGLIKELWKLEDTHLIPVLGICLGFQSMCLAFGADIKRLDEPRHGIVSEILHNGTSLFSSVEQLLATQYHSLQVMIQHRIQTAKAVRYPGELWEPTGACPDLEPLAWDFSSKRNGAVLMAAKHKRKPFWGVQFHPESICTNGEGIQVIQNWWSDAQLWKEDCSYSQTRGKSMPPLAGLKSPVTNDVHAEGIIEHTKDDVDKRNEAYTPEELASLIANGDGESLQSSPPTSVHCATTGSGRLTVSDIVELFDIPRGDAIVLESGLQPNLLPVAGETGRHSIIGLVIPGETLRIHYYVGNRTMQLRDGNDKIRHEWQVIDPWQWIRSFMVQMRHRMHHPPTTPTWAPFWGGLMGYASYEAGLETIGVQPEENVSYPDICFAYITRSIVVDHQLKKVYIHSIRGEEDGAWVREAWEKIYEAVGRKSQESTPTLTPMPKPDPFEHDSMLNTYLASCTEFIADRSEYCVSVATCQSNIADGQSYELCFTTNNRICARKPRICRLSYVENNCLSWKLYKRLGSQNPAPFGAYMRMHNMHILSSSPERYISWDRSQVAQCRPIKGTVAKKPGVTAADAHAILSSSKERAENLMIVDLVRHQLHGVYGSGNVTVGQLMEIEEFKTLWQLVSVIDAVPRGIQKPQTPDGWEESKNYLAATEASQEAVEYLGFDAFIQSLPPGSMTGAPKKRSCELLQCEEGKQRRGIYSGVLGYLDIGGGGDFSVIIRTAVKIDHTSTSSTEDTWTIGAGGAITSQSVPDAEYEEMVAKFQSTARAFKPQSALAQTEEEEMKLDQLRSVSPTVHGDDGGEGEQMAAILLGTLQRFQEQLVMLERESLRLNPPS